MVENIINEYDLIGGIKRRRPKKSKVLFYISIFLIIIFIGFLIYLIAKPSSTNPDNTTNSANTTNPTSTSNSTNNKEIGSKATIVDNAILPYDYTQDKEKLKNAGCIYDKPIILSYKDNNSSMETTFNNTLIKSKNGRWCLLPGYISKNGKENINWKYTNDANDKKCMNNWTYYDSDGNIIKNNISNITKLKDNKNWCPLNVYIVEDNAVENGNINYNKLELNPKGENKIWKYVN